MAVKCPSSDAVAHSASALTCSPLISTRTVGERTTAGRRVEGTSATVGTKYARSGPFDRGAVTVAGMRLDVNHEILV
jgi:hypothetical protein